MLLLETLLCTTITTLKARLCVQVLSARHCNHRVQIAATICGKFFMYVVTGHCSYVRITQCSVIADITAAAAAAAAAAAVGW
jgi:hypothetical protein